MPDRITLTGTHFMQLDGQWQLVHGGSVVDVRDGAAFAKSSTPVAEAAGTVTNSMRALSVRNVRKP